MSPLTPLFRQALCRPVARAAVLPLRASFSSSSASPIASTSRLSEQATTASTPSAGEKALKDKLEKELDGAKVDVQDVSGGCGSFYAISISHPSFKGLSTMKQHRIVNGLLAEEIKAMHGLQLKTSAE